MKLYFYKLDKGVFDGKPKGITVKDYEVIEKSKTYFPADGGNFPGYMCFVRKADIGKIIGYDNSRIVLAESNFEYAKNKFRELAESAVKQVRERLTEYESVLRAINESEE